MADQLQNQLRNAIRQQNLKLLTFLVAVIKIPLEERNLDGMTPLYHAAFSFWPEGALFLLNHDADVQNAEPPPYLCHLFPPLIHLAVISQSETLVKELIKRGANMRLRDSRGFSCIFHIVSGTKFDLFNCLASAVTQRGKDYPDLDKDLLFIIHTTAECNLDYSDVVDFIREQQSCHQRKMFQLFAACLCLRFYIDHSAVVHFWRMAAECPPCQVHDHAKEEEMAHRSVFADVLSVNKRSLLDKENIADAVLDIHSQALFYLEKFIPEDPTLTVSSKQVLSILIREEKLVIAIAVMYRLTTIRALYDHEIVCICFTLVQSLHKLEEKPDIPFVALLDSMTTIQNCLSSLTACSIKILPAVAPQHRYDKLGSALESLLKALLRVMVIFHHHKVLASPEQLRSISSRIKDLVHSFPWPHGETFFHFLSLEDASFPSDASAIKILLGYSAEAWGTNRLKNSPPHLVPDSSGNTPLHKFALRRSQDYLLREGVLQCFLDSGAHLCTRNNMGQSVRDVLVEREIFTEGELLPSLQCLAATAFMREVRLRQTVQDCNSSAVRNFLLDHC